jgi:DNA-binding SARP family transcriptional activator/tetratricopeptide (TPR) repeat protein
MISLPGSLQVITLGRFSLLRQQTIVSGGNWKKRRVCEMFKILLSVEKHRIHREQMQGLLWSSSSQEQAANSFGKTLYLLRRALEPDLVAGKVSSYIFLEQDTLVLLPDSLQIDADLFETMSKQLVVKVQAEKQIETTLAAIDNTLALYGGEYLPDDLYEDWTQRRRDRLRHAYARLLEQAAALAIAGTLGARTCDYLRSLLDLDALDEQTHRQLMLVYARMGRRSEALNLYHSLCKALQTELRANPLPETLELYDLIQAGQITIDLAEVEHPPIRISTQKADYATPLRENAAAIPAKHAYQTPIASSISLVEESEIEQITSSSSLVEGSEIARREVVTSSYFEAGHGLHTKLIGRVEELQRLRQAYEAACEGVPLAFFVSGEAGVGKTRLAREFSLYLETQQAAVLWGTCYEMGGSLPYQPLIDMLNTDLRLKETMQLRTMLGTSAVDLAKLLPVLRTRFLDLPPSESLGIEAERYNLYNAVNNYFHAIASERFLLLVLDDLQWADMATMQLLGYLLTQRFNYRPLFLLLYRPDEVYESHPLRSLLNAQMRTEHAQEIRLKRLKESEVQQLLVQLGGHTISPSFTKEIYKHTEGNPFFIGETIRALVEGGKIKMVGESWQTTVALEELELPQRMRLVIERRLTYLSPECRITLAYAALMGRQLHSALLYLAQDLPEETIAQHLDEAMHAQILETSKGADSQLFVYETNQDTDLIFTHDKLREVLATWLNPLRRRIAHRQIAQALEKHYSSRLHTYSSKIAYHYLMAEEIARAVAYLQEAAAHAIRVYAFVDAAHLMEQAVDLLNSYEDRPLRAELLRKLSVEAYIYQGKLDKAIESGLAAAALWQELGDPLKEAQCYLDVSFSFHWVGRETAAIETIQRALTCLKQIPDEIYLLAKASVQWGLSATLSGDIPEALTQLHLADELHSRIGGKDPFISAVSLWAHSWSAFASGTLQQMLDAAQQSAALCREARMFAWEPMMTYSVAWALMFMGRLKEGANVAYETLAKAQRHNSVGAQGWAYLVLSFIAIMQGEWENANHLGQKAADIAEMMHETDLLARVFWGRSICVGWQNKWEKSVVYSMQAVQISQQDREFSLVHPYLLVQVAKASFHAGRLEVAQEYLNQAMQMAHERHYRQLPATCHRLRGRILQSQKNFEQAQSSFEQSLAELAALEDKVEYARTQESYALFFRERGEPNDAERAEGLQQLALATFRDLGVNG